jgi:hypothetical protein
MEINSWAGIQVLSSSVFLNVLWSCTLRKLFWRHTCHDVHMYVHKYTYRKVSWHVHRLIWVAAQKHPHVGQDQGDQIGRILPVGRLLTLGSFYDRNTYINFGLWNFFIYFDKNGFSYLLSDLYTNSSGHLPRVPPTYTVPRGQISHKTFLCNRKNNVQLIKWKQKSYLQLQNKKQIFFSVWNLCK